MAEASADRWPARLSSRSGLSAEINSNGSLRRLDCASVCLQLFVGNELEGGPANLYLRKPSSPNEWTALLGPSSPTRFQVDAASGRFTGSGTWKDIRYWLVLVLAESSPVWFWHVRLENCGASPVDVDLTYAQDVALAPYGAIRLNEFYVSQYIDHTPLKLPGHGCALASRQNQAVDGKYPWSLIGSLRVGASFATDALQLHGLATRAGAAPEGLIDELPGVRLQHEHSMAVIRDERIRLEPQAAAFAGFFGAFQADHPNATSNADAAFAASVFDLPEARPPVFTVDGNDASASAPAGGEASPATGTLFSSTGLLNGRELTPEEVRDFFGTGRRHEERDESGTLLSFFRDAGSHVVMREKELRVLRPHGHILRTGKNMTPDETALTSTAWMSGVFHSMVTQGHVSINRFLSTAHSYLGLFRSHGLRIFVEESGTWRQLNVPSAFEMAPNRCRWIYRVAGTAGEAVTAPSLNAGTDTIEVTAEALEFELALAIRSSRPTRFLISSHVALNDDDGSARGSALWRQSADGIVVTPAPSTDIGRRFPQGSFRIAPRSGTRFDRVGGDELLFLDGRSRQQPFVCVVTSPCAQAELRLQGQLVTASVPEPIFADEAGSLTPTLSVRPPTAGAHAADVQRLAEIVPWFAQNAFIHYLSPRGLEQYSGGGWGTRDVCQGPVELLLALGRTEPIRDLLIRVLGNQNSDGDWPQWFMFFERERGIRAGDSHGDIVFWPLVVLAQYLTASADVGILDEVVPFFDQRGVDVAERASVWEHVKRALALIERRVIPGTSLAAYGHGDWNDSLQPADPRMRERLCSAWTVTLHYQALTSLAAALKSIGRSNDATPLDRSAEAVRADFRKRLVVDDVLTGYALFDEAEKPRYLLHPDDTSTGVHYSSLAMIHAILEDLLTPAQCRAHLALIDQRLSAPDGTRLFDRPMTYHGGRQQLFQRAETATFFGREIGLMYMHAHLRFAQALAHMGEADRFFRALCQANPIGIRQLVPAATLRQANCYYSSSDAAFRDRYQASEEYERVARGSIALDGGWRVYSSGAGIALGLIVRRFLGVSAEAAALRIDPVIPADLDGLLVDTTLLGRSVQLRYRVRGSGCGVTRVVFNDTELTFTPQPNPHRRGAALAPMKEVRKLLRGTNVMQIEVGT